MDTTRMEAPTLGAVRILVGLMWLANLHWKVPPHFGKDTGGGLYKYIATGAENAPFAPFRWLLREVVLPNYTAFGWFTLVSELLVAMLLLAGYRSRLVALAGAMLAFPIFLSVIYYPRADEWSWSYLLMIGIHLALAASPSGRAFAIDGVLARPSAAVARALTLLGGSTILLGALGWFVSRDADFSGGSVRLLGSDAGFVADGGLVRRWELKFLWFNPLWAILTIVLGIVLVLAARKLVLGYVAAAGFALMSVVVLFQQTFDYLRDDGQVQVVATGSNAAVWGALALAAGLFAHHGLRDVSGSAGHVGVAEGEPATSS